MNRSIEILINNHPVKIELAQDRKKPKVACLGPEGTYTEEAREVLLGDNLPEMDANFLKYNAEVVKRVDDEEYDIGIVPVENAIAGDVVEVLRELVHARTVTILGETVLPIDHMLIGWPGGQIEEVCSHQQALDQCTSFLNGLGNNYPELKLTPTSSTAAAVEEIRGRHKVAAIASRRVAMLYGVPILQEHIGDNPYNSTRFFLIGRGETEPTNADSTFILFTPDNEYTGLLVDCLKVFSDRGVNLSEVNSHPRGIMGRHQFLAKLDAHYKESKVQEAFSELRDPKPKPNGEIPRYRSEIKLLGSYRKAELPAGVRDPGVINGNG